MVGKPQLEKYASSALRAQGIKHGVSFVERSHFVDEDGEMHEEDMFWREDRRHSSNKCAQMFIDGLIKMRCMPPDPEDALSLKTAFLFVQWLAVLCDLTAAIVAVVTFDDVTYCCGKPILDMAGNIPWKQTVRILTLVYLGMVLIEVWPVVGKGLPMNLINPLIGFFITAAMFFDDSKNEALIMWGIETAAIACEFGLYRLKVRQIANTKKELQEVGRKTKKLRPLEDGEDPDAPRRDLTKHRRRYYQLKQEQVDDNVMLWYLALGSYINITLSILVLVAILFIAQGGGLCVDNFQVPNFFDLDQLGRCPLCAALNETGVCEVCTGDSHQCYYPYS